MSRQNKIILIGQLTSTPETKALQSGDTVSSFTLNVPRPTLENAPQKSDIFTIVSWRDLAEKTSTLQEGNLVLVEGSIKNSSYESNGQRLYKTEIEARTITSLTASGSAPLSSHPIVEETTAENAPVFDFNDAIQQPSEPVLSAELGEDVPF